MWFDLRTAYRSMAKARGFVFLAVATIALGIVANTAAFSILKSVILNQLPFRDPGQLMIMAESDGHTPNPQLVSFATVEDWRQRSRSFEAFSLFKDFDVTAQENGRSDFIRGMAVSANFFDTLGIRMLLGRTFVAEDDRPETRNKLIITYGLWKRRFGGDGRIIGKVIPSTDGSWSIVGVLPPDFHPLHMTNEGEVPALFATLGYDQEKRSCRTCRGLRLIGRLENGVAPGQARAELNSIMRQLAVEHPADYARDAAVVVTPLRDMLIGRFETSLWLVFGAVGLLLLLACANVSSLVLVRATGRQKEMAVRAALGAGRARIVRQLLTETLLLALAGGMAGVAAAYGVTRLISSLGTQEIPRMDEIRPDLSMLLWGFGASTFSGVVCGLLPAWEASRTDVQSVLRAEAGASQTGAKRKLQQALIVAEIAVAFVLVLGVGLLGKSYWRLLQVNIGYDPRNILTMSLLPDWNQYDSIEKRLQYYEDVANRVRGVPGVESVAYASTLPLSHPNARRVYVRERRLPDTEAPRVEAYYVSADFFRTMKIPLVRGRLIDGRDRRGLLPVAVISESCARTQFKGEDPLGRHIQLEKADEHAPWATIVGVVGDVHQYGLDLPADSATYTALVQAVDPQGYGSLIVRCKRNPERMETAVTNAMRSVDPTQVIFHVQPMDAYIAKSLAQRTFILWPIGVLGGLALLLAAVGIYGVISHSVAMRVREVGIRIALGAEPGDVIGMILRQISGAALAGLAIGLSVWLLCCRLVSSMLFEVKATDFATVGSVGGLICAVALIATYFPARKAARLNPMKALRLNG
jgi:putative ABC transport system permease protein